MVKLTDVTGIGPATVKLLSEHKIKTVEALASISLEELQKIPGMNGDIRARAIKKAAADCLRSKAAKEISASVNNTQTTVKKVASRKTVATQPVKQAEADEEKGKEKKKDKKGDKKKDKKNKDKNKKKDKKKKGKDKKKS